MRAAQISWVVTPLICQQPHNRGMEHYVEWYLFISFVGGLGQLGTECARMLRKVYGEESVILSDIVRPNEEILENGPYIFADILDFKVCVPGLFIV